MELNLTKIKSLLENNLTTNKFGMFPEQFRNPDYNIPQYYYWTAPLSENVVFTIREFVDSVAQTIYDSLTDADSTGGSISGPNSYGGGNKTASNGNILLKAVADPSSPKTASIKIGESSYEITLDDINNLIKITDNELLSLTLNTTTGIIEIANSDQTIVMDKSNEVITVSTGNNCEIEMDETADTITLETSTESVVVGNNSISKVSTKKVLVSDWVLDSGKYKYVWSHGVTLDPIWSFLLKMYKPDNLVANPNFDDSSSWTAGSWSISGGVASHTSGSTALSQGITLVAGVVYTIVYEIKTRTSGSVQVKIGGAYGTARSAVGVYEEQVTSVDTTGVYFETSDLNGSIDNVYLYSELKEVTPYKVTFGTGAAVTVWSEEVDPAFLSLIR
jgi:hypothetical protein